MLCAGVFNCLFFTRWMCKKHCDRECQCPTEAQELSERGSGYVLGGGVGVYCQLSHTNGS